MKYESVAQTWVRYHQDKANGVKRTPLHTLQECCEAAGIDYRWFGRVAAKQPGAPQPVLQFDKNRWKAGKKYYRKHEFVQWINQVRQQKEKAMPDIKTALQQALAKTATEWAADDEAHQKIDPVPATTPKEKTVSIVKIVNTDKQDGRITNNVSRTTFEYIRDNPGLTIDEVTAALVAKGFKTNSVSSLCYQMIRVRLVVADANGKLTAVVREYAPIQTSLLRGRRSKPKAKAKPTPTPAPAPTPVAAGLASIAPVVAVDAPLPRKYVEITNKRTGEVINPRKEEWTVESVIGSLNVRQAMAVYDELRKIFGG